ncbi:MAG: DUF2309 domain-containing protein [Bryobacteraceae bacterium]
MEPRSSSAHGSSRAESLEHTVSHTAHMLPAQGPIGVFIHHNTLHAFQHMPFEQAVVEASKVYGTEPYMREEEYRKAVGSGRILIDDIDAVLAREKDFDVWPGMTRRELRRRLLVPGIKHFQAETVQWDLDEGGLLDTKAARSLFEVCLRETPLRKQADAEHRRARDGVLAATGTDLDTVIHPWLIRLCAVFTDQGLSYWPMPNREEGLLGAAMTLLQQPFCLLPSELGSLPGRCKEIAGVPAVDVVCRIFDILGIPESQWDAAVQTELLALGGWAGMIYRLQEEPELAPHEIVPATLMDFLALRMLLTVSAVDALMPGRLKAWKSARGTSDDPFGRRLASAATLFDAAGQVEGPASRIAALRTELDLFDELERRRILHIAYERRHERQILLPMQEHRRRKPLPQSEKLSAQVFFCLDEREESIRRHLEEIAPHIETFGAVGFYGVAINYTGLDDAHGVSLCPVVVKPAHAVTERPVEGHWGSHARRVRMRRMWAWVAREWSVSSRTLVRGWVGTTVLGVFSIVPMAARVFSPRRYGKLIAWLNASILPEPRTELAFERKDAEGHTETFDLLKGFTVEEKVDRVAAVLTMAGLRRGMARLVVVLGHGSTSLNNPHESAYNCGACGGRRGGPNGRLFAAMANLPGVRAGLKARGIIVPDDTWFVGGNHDTCNDDIDLYDLEAVPHTHRRDLADVRAALDKARALSAHERTRRFASTRWLDGPSEGLRHVQGRAEHLAEPRPEYGHSSNAVCIVGRRSSTRGLFLDRRAFLVSYDMANDPNNSSLAGLLGAVFVVCAGINLEYYFSYVDNERFGCGSKLPHNVTGLLGVMNGYESDLRTGLTLQMVEIHEPVRILFVIESTPERIEQTVKSNALNWEFLEKRWIRVASMDPATGVMKMYRDGVWEAVEGEDERLGSAASSMEWYAGHREHLGIARIETGARA